jgi:hypothetical protein
MDYHPDSPDSSPHECDQDQFDSSSSSSDPDQSSPSAYASPASATHAQWAYDLGSFVGLPQSNWGAAEPVFGVKIAEMDPEFGVGVGAGGDEASLALTSDFWSTAPSTTVHSPNEHKHYVHGLEYFSMGSEDAVVKMEDCADDLTRGMEVEFEDVVHDDVCG